ncbi:MAG: DUF2061 domain-containing protein [Moraxellaceae bacterium]
MAQIQTFVISNQRTLKKTFSYYVMHMTVAAVVAFIVTGNIWMALTLSLLEPTIQAFAFFFHEKAWVIKDDEQLPKAEPAANVAI